MTLTGSADASYWRELLRHEGVQPLDVDGRARVTIIAADAVFRGLRFQEVSFSIVLESDRDDAAFLVEAFNSRRVLAWSERVLFRMPCRYAPVRVTDAGFSLLIGGAVAFRAEQGALRKPAVVDDMWDGHVYLAGGRRFASRRTGKGEFTPFDETDLLVIDGTRTKVLPHLALSEFRAESWLIRDARVTSFLFPFATTRGAKAGARFRKSPF